MKVSLILFTRNEIEGLKEVYPRIPLSYVDELIAVDGHSTDGSVEYLQSKGVKVVSQQKLGRGNATIEGVEHSSGDAIVFLSSDGNEDPLAIPRLIEKLEDSDVAVASRFMKGGRSDDSDDPLLIRRFGNRFFTFLVNAIWKANVTDSTNGLRGIRRSAWNRLRIDSPYHETEFQMTIRTAKLDMKIAEIPTVEGQRIGGARYASTAKMGWTFTKFLLREVWIGNRFETQTDDMKRDVQTHYDKIAPVYERRKRDFYLRMIRENVKQLGGRRIVDLGCGTGLALSWFDGDRVGVDFSKELLGRAHEGPDYVLADVEACPFRNESFDSVLCLDVLEHLPSLRVIDEANRILSRQGVFLLSTAENKYELVLNVLERLGLKLPEGPHNWRSHKEIVRKMLDAGFACARWSKAPVSFYKGTKN